ncbi:hypothetical protein J6590_002028 [Homalodisca vitripennis]|nr:hypothetical protein J6590_002028 [Homalodisca vitripennis]
MIDSVNKSEREVQLNSRYSVPPAGRVLCGNSNESVGGSLYTGHRSADCRSAAPVEVKVTDGLSLGGKDCHALYVKIDPMKHQPQYMLYNGLETRPPPAQVTTILPEHTENQPQYMYKTKQDRHQLRSRP